MQRLLVVSIKLAGMIGPILSLIPSSVRLRLGFFFLLLESRAGTPEAALKQLFLISDRLDWVINERALTLGGGEHPKIAMTAYDIFFSTEIYPFDTVLDIGCSMGTIAATIASKCSTAEVIGIDRNSDVIHKARDRYKLPNLRFLVGEATNIELLPEVNVVILSNVLEHIQDRVTFLTLLMSRVRPRKVLLRVPLFERSWTLPMRKRLGMPYFSDDDHYIEHTLDQFYYEMQKSGLSIIYLQTLWGEIWAKCEPLQK
jgi:SAM-dependent methyltransferase